ncbi:hypothetical protein BH11PLA2_BH11PLA2_00240 [soil metagenome]
MGEPAESLSTTTVVVPTSRLARVFWYLLTFLVAAIFPLVGYRCDHANLNVPLVHEADRLMFNDTLLLLPMVQATLEHGTHWKTDRLGFPGVQMMHDFPVIDHLHFAIIWLLGQFLGGNAVLTFNVFYLLCYPLAAISMLFVLRHFNVSFPAASACGVMFACLPYHQYHGLNHGFLSAYFFVPISCLYMIEVCRGHLPFFNNADRRFSLKDRFTLLAILSMLITSAAGAYYAFFACGLLAGAGIYAAFAFKTWKAFASSILLVGVVTVGGVANHLPTFLYHREVGKHTAPIDRSPEDSEYYGLKITQLIMPIDDHRVRKLADFKSIYNSYIRPVQTYTERYTLGTVATVGYLILAFRMLLMFPRRWPYTELSVLAMFATFIGLVGGIGAIFNQTVTPSVRCYNRIGIFIAVFALFAVAQAGDAILAFIMKWRHWPRALKPLLPLVFWGGILTAGLVDMTPFEWGRWQRVRTMRNHAKLWMNDAAFFQEIEAEMNPEGTRPGPAIFQLPYVAWPESPTINSLGAYDHARGYLQTKTLRWSYGTMKGREIDEWYRSVVLLAPNAIAPLIDRITAAGFDGLLLDKRGYSPADAVIVEQQLLKTISGANPIRHADGQQIFFDLRRHRNDIRQGRDWQAAQYRETHKLTSLWLEGFLSHREPGYEWQQRWCGPKGTAIFVNPTDETKTVTCTFRIHTEFKDPSKITIEGGSIWSEELTIDKNTPSITKMFVIPPGRHTIHFRCVPPESHIPNEHRRLCFLISGLKLD